jgi:hypothetical protein
VLAFSPKLPVSDEERQWIDKGFSRLERLLGRRRMLEAQVVLPTAEHFPDPYDKTPATAESLFWRVCAYMDVDHSRIDFEIFRDETEDLRNALPYWSGRSTGCAGLYVDESSSKRAHIEGKSCLVAIRSTQLEDPLSLVASIAHELGHVILIGGELMDPNTPDHEPLTDLLTVFLGFGIFTANSAARFQQYQDDRRQGWSMQRLGYLPQEAYGYALAKFAWERNEDRPAWSKHLSPNVRSYFKRSQKFLRK